MGVRQRHGQDNPVRRGQRDDGDEGPHVPQRHRCHFGSPDRSGIQLYTDSNGFVVHDAAGHSAPAVFIFDSENGGIDGWNPSVGATARGHRR